MSEPFHQTARLITAQLLPHTTSVHNVTLIAEALEKAYVEGYNEATKKVATYLQISVDNL